MPVTVREATVEDGEEILDLWYAFTGHLAEFNERYRAREGADEHWLSYFEDQLVDSKYSTVLLAENDDGEHVGVLEIRVVGEHPIFQLGRHAEIHGLYVREHARGEGVGEALLDKAEDWMRDDPRGVDFYRVDVVEGDEESEGALRELGLEPVKETFEGEV
jgi:GNAT superfamily N-acetyltransferase